MTDSVLTPPPPAMCAVLTSMTRRLLALGALLAALVVVAALMPETSDAAAGNATGQPRILLSEEGYFLFADVTSIKDADGLPFTPEGSGITMTDWNYDYQWVRIDANSGARTNIGGNSERYALVDADIGHTIEVIVSFMDDNNDAESLTSLPYGPIVERPSRSLSTPTTLVSNMAQTGVIATSVESGYHNGFRLGEHGQGYELTSVTIDFVTAPSAVKVSLWIGGIDGAPLSDRHHQLFDFANPDTLQAGPNTFTAPRGAFLFQHVYYWIRLTGFSGTLMVTETSSDAEDPGGEAGAFIFNNASSSGSGALRMSIQGARRDYGILASNFTKAYNGTDQEIISLGDEIEFEVTVGEADRYLVRGMAYPADDTTVLGGSMADPFRLRQGGPTGAGQFVLTNTRWANGFNEWRAPQGSTVAGASSGTQLYTFKQETESVHGNRLFATLTRVFPPGGVGEKGDENPGVDKGNPTGASLSVGGSGGAQIATPGDAIYMVVFGEPLHALVQNVGQTKNSNTVTVDTTSTHIAQGFSTGLNPLGYRLQGIGVTIDVVTVMGSDELPGDRTNLKVSLYTDSNGQPGQKLFDLVNPDEYKKGPMFFEAPPGTTLEPGTSYVLVWEHLAGKPHHFSQTTGNNEDTGAADGFSIADAFSRGAAVNSLTADTSGNSLLISVYGEPLLVVAAPSVVAGEPHVSAGGYHSCSLDADGHIGCVGRNDESQLNVPALAPDQRWAMVSAGEFHTCGLVTDGTLKCWGDNGFRQMTDTPGGSDYVAVDAGPWHTCALKDDGTFVCWGANDDGQLVDGTKPQRGKKPEADFGKINWIDKPTGATALMVSAGGSVLGDSRSERTSHSYTCVLWSSGDVGCAGATPASWDARWHGIKSNGGDGNSPPFRCNLITDRGFLENTNDARCAPSNPLRHNVLNVPELENGLHYTSVSVGGKHACATVNDGGIRCWGRKYDSALGPLDTHTPNGDVISERYGTSTGMAYGTPPPPVGFRWRSVSCGHYHTCAIAEPLGGGLAGSGPSEQPDDGLDYTVFEGFTLHEDDVASTGMWSDGDTLWTVSHNADRTFSYHLRDDPSTEADEYGTIDESKTAYSLFSHFIRNLTGDGTYLWLTEELPHEDGLCTDGACSYGYGLKTGGLKILQHRFDSVDEMGEKVITGLVLAHATASDGRRMFIGENGFRAHIFSIWDDPSTTDVDEFGQTLGTIQFSGDFNISTMYTDGEVLWAAGNDLGTDEVKVEARTISDGARRTDLEFSFPTAMTDIDGIWSNGVTFLGMDKRGTGNPSTIYVHRFRHRATPPGLNGASGAGGASAIGDVLRADTSVITDADGLPSPLSPTYRWQRDGGGGWANISGQTSASYTVRQADEGARIRVVVRFTDSKGFNETVASPWSRVGEASNRLICWGAEVFFNRNNPHYPNPRSNPPSSPARDHARLPSAGGWHSCWVHGSEDDPLVTCMGDQDFRQSQWRLRTVSEPTTLVSNLGETRFSSGVALQTPNSGAISFKTGSSQAPFALTSVEIDAYADMSDTAGLAMSVWSSHIPSEGSEPRPKAERCTLTPPAALTEGTVHTFVADGACRLTASTTYWLVFESPTSSFSVAVTESDDEDGDSRSNWTIGDEIMYRARTSSGPWSGMVSTTLNPMRFAIKGHFQGLEQVSAEQNLGPQALTLGPIRPKLVAEFQHVPIVHDGSGAFTVTLTFSDEVTISLADLKQHALSVTGGSIMAVARASDAPRKQFELTIQPSSNEAVSLFTSPTSDCNAQGALCTKDGRRLALYQAILIHGPPDVPDTGLPEISGVTVMGQTLTADVSGIMDPDGLTSATFAYQWVRKSDDAQSDIAGATGATYTLSEEDVGQRIRVRVRYNDDAGNNHSLTSAETERVTRPRLGSVEVIDGTETTAVVEVVLRGSIGAAIPIYVGYRVAHTEDDWTIVEGTTDPSTGKVAVTLSGLTEGSFYWLRGSMNRELDPFLFETFTAGRTAAEPDEGDYVEGNPAAPGTPTFEPGDGSLTISWDPPPDNGTAPVTRYLVEIRNEAQTFEQGGFYTLSPEDVPYTIEQLANGVTYFVRVSAGNSDEIVDGRYVVGPATEEASAVPGTGTVALGTPIVSSHEYLHHRMLKLDWQDIENADWYEVQYHHPTANKWVSLPYGDITIAQHGSSAVLGNLNVGFLWFVRVRALGCGGPSEWSEIQQILSTSEADFAEVPVPVIAPGDTRPESSGQCPPATPILAEPTHPQHLAMTLDWQDVEGATSYEVQYHHPDGNRWVTLPHGDITVTFNGSSAVLENLHDGLLWFVRVRSVNAAGESAWSEILQSFSTSADDFEANEPDEDALSATFGDAPASHDGVTAFTVELTFSQNIKMGFQAMRDDVLDITGGTVARARRLTQGSNIGWEITIQPTGAADIAISLPASSDCSAAGAVCTHEGAMLTTAVGLSVEGPGS